MAQPTPEQIAAAAELLSITPDEFLILPSPTEQIENARIVEERAALMHAAELVTAGQNAILNGEMTNQEFAAALLTQGESLAHDMHLAAWQAEEKLEEAVDSVDWLMGANAESYSAWLEDKRAEEEERKVEEQQDAQNQLAAAQIQQAYGQLIEHMRSTPGAHENADAMKQRLDELIVEGQGSGLESLEGQRRLIAQADHDLAIRDSLSAGLVEQVEVEWRAHEHARKSRQFTTRQSDDRSPQQRAVDAQEWKENRLEELAASTYVDPNVRDLPPTAAEETAAQLERIQSRNEQAKSLAMQVGGIAARGKEASAVRDRGEGISDEKKRYREAYARAENAAAYGEFADVKTGYADSHEGTVEASAKPGGYGPDGSWPDELGPAI